MPIRILDAATVGRIAAGEVVERPSSVVKELVENSLDAGATAITVEIRGGGIDYLRVTDNGCGIEPGQVRLAFENHATSKLQNADQLNDIRTLGFRGEALPSIASVAHVEMTTRARGQDSGVRLNVDGGENLRVRDYGCPEGTTFVMKDLFYNIPVRRAFLKKPSYEGGLVSDAVARLMIGNPGVSMRFINNGNTVFHSFGDGKLRHAIFAVYGKAAAEKMIELDAAEGGTRVYGMMGVGELAKSTRAHQMFFINGRSVRCALLSKALEQVCRSRVTIGMYPMCALNLVLPPNAIDVNVHPNKLEVRFRDEAATQTAVEKLLGTAFEGEKVLSFARDAAPAPEIRREAAVREITPEEMKRAMEQAKMPPLPKLEKPVQTRLFETSAQGQAKPLDAARPLEASAQDRVSTVQPLTTSTGSNLSQLRERDAAQDSPVRRISVPDPRSVIAAPAGQTAPETPIHPGSGSGLQTMAAAPAGQTAPETPVRLGSVPDPRTMVAAPGQTAPETPVRPGSGSNLQMVIAAPTGQTASETPVRPGSVPDPRSVIAAPAGQTAPEMPNRLGSVPDPRSVIAAPGQSASESPASAVRREEPKMPELAPKLDERPAYRVLGVAFKTYIIIEVGETLLLIDQHAAHERLRYEMYVKQLESGTASQQLLTPIVVRLSSREMALIQENLELLSDAGYTVEPFGENDIQVRAVPYVLGKAELRPLFMDMINSLSRLKAATLDARRAEIMQMACKSAVKGGDALSESEIDALIGEMLATGAPPTCPHGRPVVKAVSRRDLEKMFKRIQ